MSIFPEKIEDPTPEEIAARSAEIRKGWDEKTKKKRARWAHSKVRILMVRDLDMESATEVEDWD
jgi:hypothetical protein